MAALFTLLTLAFALVASGKRLCDNEHVHLDFGPDESFIASFGGGGVGGINTVFVRDIGG